MTSPISNSSGPSGEKHHSFVTNLLLHEFPYGLVMLLTLAGVAYTSFSKQPIITYWEILTPIIGVACILSGWRRTHTRQERLRLIWTQVLHWAAFLVAMNMVLLPSVQNLLNSNASGIAILLLLALGTFVAGVHTMAWHYCALGLIMAICVPAIAWLEESTLIILLGILALGGIGILIWWAGQRWSAR